MRLKGELQCMYCVEFFWNQKIFHLYVYIIFLKKLSANISDSSFLLDSLSKAKIFLNFSTGENFRIFNRFWNKRFSKRLV